ncbi:serine hydrolase domain-containing protein [Pleomorphomonas carboxyditropha]|uniref:Serine hydrolase n=1 Tax=Pleomorphomonas carboxyditropha TaxID=2023338 RepID=A0A2G9X1G8_9HYPH|nr:serine hydrolase domain-containing protein [Pleomorphomonas carboxyditropha]PIP00819.1 serine hydrolase [Pleomorphomonas carboxyditropha]
MGRGIHFSAVDAVVDRAVGRTIVGANILIELDGELVYSRQAGYLDREALRPVAPRTLFRLASVTKPMVSVAALAMVEAGRLRLDDPVTRYLPDFQPRLADGSAPPITISQLMTHTSGLTYEVDNGNGKPACGGTGPSDFDLAENIRRIAALPLAFAPGTGWRYSVGIDVLGGIMEVADGRTLPEIVKARVTDPLGMPDTAFWPTDPDRLAVPYADGTPPIRMGDTQLVKDGDGFVLFWPGRAFDRTAFPSGGAGMIGTAEDFLVFLEAMRKGGAPLLSAASMPLLTEAHTVDLDPAPSGQGYSHGWSIYRDPSVQNVPCRPGTWAWGGIYGHQWYVDPATGLTIVIFTNTALEGCTGAFPKDVFQAVYAALGD